MILFARRSFGTSPENAIFVWRQITDAKSDTADSNTLFVETASRDWDREEAGRGLAERDEADRDEGVEREEEEERELVVRDEDDVREEVVARDEDDEREEVEREAEVAREFLEPSAATTSGSTLPTVAATSAATAAGIPTIVTPRLGTIPMMRACSVRTSGDCKLARSARSVSKCSRAREMS